MLVREPITGLWHDPSIVYPINYGRQLVSLDELIRRELGIIGGPCLPEYRLRLVNVIIWHQGNMGVGDGWRPCPSNTSEASKRCESLHQDQRYDDGRRWWSAADMVCRNPNGFGVHVSPPTHDLPVQGTAAAAMFGIHANVGTPGQGGWESWHAQVVEQDGFGTWVNAGRRYPVNDYPFPVLHPAPQPPKPDPIPEPTPDPTPTPIGDIDMIRVDYGIPGTDWWWSRTIIAGNTIAWVQGEANRGLDQLVPGHIQVQSDQHMLDLLSTYKAIGPPPSTWETNTVLTAAWYASAAK